MTMSPPPADDAPQPFQEAKRPGSLTFIGVVGIIFGAFGVLCLCIGVTSAGLNQGKGMPQMSTNDLILSISTAVVGLVISVMILLGSIAALNVRIWSRTLLIVVAGVNLIFELFKLIVAFAHQIPVQIEMMQNPPAGMTADQIKGMQMILPYAKPVIYGLTLLLFAVQAAYSIGVFMVMNRPNVKAALSEPTIPDQPPPSSMTPPM